jgi:hypothetical protein
MQLFFKSILSHYMYHKYTHYTLNLIFWTLFYFQIILNNINFVKIKI